MPTLLHVSPTFAIGGIQRRTAQLITLGFEGYHHDLLALDGCYDSKILMEEAGNVSYLPPPDQSGNLLARVFRFQRVLAAQKPAALLTYNWGSIDWALANWFCGLPHIHFEDGFGVEESERLLPRRNTFRRIVLKNARRVVVPSRTLETIAGQYWRVPPSRLMLIPNGVPDGGAELSADEKAAGRARLGLAEDDVLIGWVGTMRPEKNLPRLARAFCAVTDKARLVLIGDGPERSALEEEAARHDLSSRLDFLGVRKDVEAILPYLDILALSSDTEQMPIVLLEAMAAGLPVASLDVGDVKNMMSTENEPYIVGRSDEDLARSLFALVTSADLRKSIGSANRMKARTENAITTMTQRHEALVASVMDKSAR